TDYIATQGYIVNRNMTYVSITTPSSYSLRGPTSPTVILDGMPLHGDLSPLITLKTNEVSSISINKTGFGGGLTGAGGIIKINTKLGDFTTGGKAPETTRAISMDNGFAADKEVYAPLYSNYITPSFSHYGVIAWLSNAQMNPSGNKTPKLMNTVQDKINLYIQGFTAKGELISEQLTIDTK